LRSTTAQKTCSSHNSFICTPRLQKLQYGIATAGAGKPYNGKHYQEAVMVVDLGILVFLSFMAGLIDAAVVAVA
jgi:hypothetical protein